MQIYIDTTVVFALPAEKEAAEQFRKKYQDWYCLAQSDEVVVYVRTELTNFPLFAKEWKGEEDD